MKKLFTGLLFFLLVSLTHVLANEHKTKDGTDYSILTIQLKNAEASEASFFNESKRRAVIFVPGKIFNKESWHFLASKLKRLGISSLCLDGKSSLHISKAAQILRYKGFEKIYLVGASMGGASVLYSLEDIDKLIDKVVVLAPFGGEAIKSTSIKKLFIVAKDDGWGAQTYPLFKSSSEPKTFKEYNGAQHAQHLFKGKHKESLTTTIVDFLNM